LIWWKQEQQLQPVVGIALLALLLMLLTSVELMLRQLLPATGWGRAAVELKQQQQQQQRVLLQ
jgi:hypothetical protein